MTGAEALIQQGIEQGRVDEKRSAVIKLLRHQFPDVSEPFVNEISAIEELSLLDTLFEQTLAATTLNDIQVPKRDS